ncbi:DUF6390 family protein [Streptomyces sp. NPDC093085]|uniref:DUF6390 family protein n=1 Tax=Streptomyces sp. NPDC093085 TaxID=3155068 RepID=UPI003415FEB5
MSERGALLFARYAYPPNELGYCGPEDAGALLRAEETAGIERHARRFEGAWCYLELLAETAGLDDPLDERVVEAYWIGNELVERTRPETVLARLLSRFDGQGGGTWREAAGRALAHHTFQVFDVYPWARLLPGPAHPTALSVLDRCRIRTGVVRAVRGESATVECRPLRWTGTHLIPGPPHREPVRWSTGGRSLLPGLAPGDVVALHWDWVCDILTPAQAARVESTERRHLTALGLSPCR